MKIPTFFKSLMTAIIFFLIPWEGKATGLSGDVIYLQGEEWGLLAKPINKDSNPVSSVDGIFAGNHCITTANRDAIPPIGKCSNLVCICIIWKSVYMIGRRKKSIPSPISQTS